jgi:hypothetical protein
MVTRNILRGARTGSFLVCVVFHGAAILSAQSTNKAGAVQASCIVPKDEINALAAIYSHTFHVPEVIITETEIWSFPDTVNLQLAAQGRGLPPDLRKDFDDKNRFRCTISPFISDTNVHFISGAESRQIFQIGWNEFYRRFGKNAGIASISRVGFNSDKTLALVHTSGAFSPNGAAGTLYLLQRNRNKWTVKFSMQIEAV